MDPPDGKKITFLTQPKAVPEAIREEIKREIGHYTVPMIVNGIGVGSGTLVTIDGHDGILTAEHVVRHPECPDLHLTKPAKKLQTAVVSFAHDLSITSDALRIVITSRRTDRYGPDLAFIVLPPSAMRSELHAKKSFYNLTKDTAGRLATALDRHGLISFNGYPAVKYSDRAAEQRFSRTLGVLGYSFVTGVKRYRTKEGWDYLELGVKAADADHFAPPTEKRFGGVSGGGVWRIPVVREAGSQPGAEFPGR